MGDVEHVVERVIRIMADEQEGVVSFFPQRDVLTTFTTKQLAHYLVKRGFTVEQCRILEGKSLNLWILGV